MIVFSAVVPHSPLLIPAVGKDHLAKLETTRQALLTLEQELYATRPDTLVIFTPHGPAVPDAFAIALEAKYTGSLKDFGDFGTKIESTADFMLIDHIQRGLRDKNLPVTLQSGAELDYSVVVPLYYLTPHLQKYTLVPIASSLLDLKTHLEFGRALQDELAASNKRIAVLASADLAHRLLPESPEGFSPRAKDFDDHIRTLLTSGKAEDALAFDPGMVKESGECGLRPIIMLLGTLDGMNIKPEILSYEGPFGTGYLVANLTIG
jgi:aromatic ring-opening dioxygenase LigB subunit